MAKKMRVVLLLSVLILSMVYGAGCLGIGFRDGDKQSGEAAYLDEQFSADGLDTSVWETALTAGSSASASVTDGKLILSNGGENAGAASVYTRASIQSNDMNDGVVLEFTIDSIDMNNRGGLWIGFVPQPDILSETLPGGVEYGYESIGLQFTWVPNEAFYVFVYTRPNIANQWASEHMMVSLDISSFQTGIPIDVSLGITHNSYEFTSSAFDPSDKGTIHRGGSQGEHSVTFDSWSDGAYFQIIGQNDLTEIVLDNIKISPMN